MNEIVSFSYDASISGPVTLTIVMANVTNEMIDAVQFALINQISLEIEGRILYPMDMDIQHQTDHDVYSLSGAAIHRYPSRRTLAIRGYEAI